MAATYTVAYLNVAYASAKNMFAIYNGSGSGKIVKIRRIWMISSSSTATGTFGIMSLGRFSNAYTGGTGGTFLKHDSNSASVPAQIVTAQNPTAVTINGLIRVIGRSGEEIVVSDNKLSAFGALVPLNCIYDAGYGDANVQPITLRETEGIVLQAGTGVQPTGSTSMYIELTLE